VTRLPTLLALLTLPTGCASSSPALDLVARLRDPDPEVRERAADALRAMGSAADPALREHLDDYDAEVASRCRDLLLARATDAEWYALSGLNGTDLQLVTWALLVRGGAHRLAASVGIATLAALMSEPAVPLSSLTTCRAPDTLKVEIHESLRARVEAALPPAEGATLLAHLRDVCDATGGDFCIARWDLVRIAPREQIFKACWADHHRALLRWR
jgi:hypothetical protein